MPRGKDGGDPSLSSWPSMEREKERERDGDRREPGDSELRQQWRQGQRVYVTNPEQYELLEEVGQGGGAVVYKARCIPLDDVVAIKSMDLERVSSTLEDIRREAQILGTISHPNLVHAYCSFAKEHYLWVVMPFMERGSCLHLMKAHFPNGLEEAVIATILRETLKGLDYLHRHGHIHRDVKAGNILLDGKGNVKLADFGVSACMFDTGDRLLSRKTFTGTPCWMAPEVIEAEGYDFKADIWSFGITALELAHGHAPFDKYPPMKVLMMTLQGPSPGLDAERDRKFSKAFKEMVAMCLVKDPSKRPSAEKLLKHSFFKQAKSADFLVKALLRNLPPLGESVKMLKSKDEALLAAKKVPLTAQEERSQQEYKLGVSGWNFDVEDLKRQAAMLDDEPDVPPTIPEGDSVKGSSDALDALAEARGQGSSESVAQQMQGVSLSGRESNGAAAPPAPSGTAAAAEAARGSAVPRTSDGGQGTGISVLSAKASSAPQQPKTRKGHQVKGRFKVYEGDHDDD